jgi:hypothetical protein
MHYQRFMKHGSVENNLYSKHGLSETPTHRSWWSMRNRCLNKNAMGYNYWGGRGVQICSRWNEKYVNFFEDMGERPQGTTLDRIDNDGHYSCGKCDQCNKNGWTNNCRWATVEQQNRNKRPKKNNTGYPGVSKSWDRYRARVFANGKRITLGTFDTPEQAYEIYLKAKASIG